ncbi:MAG: hypothetical protein F6J86_39715, partial [Symploca sp. SIO1B1]|nr:hypothetical protein [Symploca sp. SIO1B1]
MNNRESRLNSFLRRWRFHSEKSQASEKLINHLRNLKIEGASLGKSGDYTNAKATLDNA